MSVHDPLSPDWRSAEAYRPLLGAEPAVWAWEFGRRAVNGGNGRDPGAALQGVADLCFAGAGPSGDHIPAVLWTWRADPSVPVLEVEPALRNEGAALDLQASPLAVLVVRTADDEQHVLISDGPRRLRLAIVRGDVLSGPVACRFRLPPHAMGATSLDGLRRLLVLRDTGLLPSASARRSTKSSRWVEILRAHDARRAGASQRQIAVLLFGQARVQEDWSGGSNYMRMRVQRLLRSAEALVAGGFRAVCGLTPEPAKRARIVDIWRSPAWRGSGLAVVVLALLNLGASLGQISGLHGVC